MVRARAGESVFSSLDVVRAKNYWYCRDGMEVNWFSKTEFASCLRELGYRVKWETAFRKLRKEAERGEYITYLNGKGGTYKLLVRLTPFARG